MSTNKKIIRENFRNSVFKRDNYSCKVCNIKNVLLDAHHITNRNEMPNGGYVKENGVSLCEKCHIDAEHYLQTKQGRITDEYLYKLIKSSKEQAIEASKKLK